MMVVLALSVICVATYGIANFQQSKFGEVPRARYSTHAATTLPAPVSGQLGAHLHQM